MADSKRFSDWYKKAEIDLSTAQILFAHDGDNAAIAFHCQQAAEKALKGFLLKEAESLFGSHSLVYLCKKASWFQENLGLFIKDCAYLNQFYIETRYPADDPMEIDVSEAEECVRIAKAILDTVAR